MEKMLFQDVQKNETNIREICSTDEKRVNLLQNTMKRIETSHRNGFLIKNSNDQFLFLASLVEMLISRSHHLS